MRSFIIKGNSISYRDSPPLVYDLSDLDCAYFDFVDFGDELVQVRKVVRLKLGRFLYPIYAVAENPGDIHVAEMVFETSEEFVDSEVVRSIPPRIYHTDISNCFRWWKDELLSFFYTCCIPVEFYEVTYRWHFGCRAPLPDKKQAFRI